MNRTLIGIFGGTGDAFNPLRTLALAGIYGAILYLAGIFALLIRFDFAPGPDYQYYYLLWLGVVFGKLAALSFLGQFRGLLSYFSIPDLRRIVMAMLTCSFGLIVLRYLPASGFSPPRGIILSDFVLSVGGLALVRLAFRMAREGGAGRSIGRRRPVAILGAGDVGAKLASELMAKRGLGIEPVAFFDDDRSKQGSSIHGIPIVGVIDSIKAEKFRLGVSEVIIAIPSVTPKRMKEIISLLQEVALPFETVPAIDQLATGQVKVSHIREVRIDDLLGREPVTLDQANIADILANETVLVTGAGGSIGSELCRQIASFNPRRLILVEQSEVQIFQIEQELVMKGYGGVVLPLVADVLDEKRMDWIFRTTQPAVVFHAAAHKHVPLMESQPGEALRNNSLGTALLARLSLKHAVDRFVLISTDKAINPTNVMGASKRMAEIYLQSLFTSNPSATKFMAVRFGNVLGSSGSVIPTFKKQIAAGGPIKVTHPDVTRYFMTIPEAVGLVLQSSTQGEGGEIFVLDMGEPVKIVDLARQMIELSGLRPEEDIEIEFIGLRPGEKLFEELSHVGECFESTSHPKIMKFLSQAQSFEEVTKIFERLSDQVYVSEASQLKLLIKETVPEYKPYLV